MSKSNLLTDEIHKTQKIDEVRQRLIGSELIRSVFSKQLNSVQILTHQFQSGAALNAGQTIDVAGAQYSISTKENNCIAFKQEALQ